MIFLAGIGVLGIGIGLVVLMVAPDQSKVALVMLMVSGVVLAPILAWQMYLGTLVPHDLESEFAVVPDIKGRASHPADPDLEAERAFLDGAADDPTVSDVMGQIRAEWDAGALQVWIVRVSYPPEDAALYHLLNPAGGWILADRSNRHLLFKRGVDRGYVVTQPHKSGSWVFYGLRVESDS